MQQRKVSMKSISNRFAQQSKKTEDNLQQTVFQEQHTQLSKSKMNSSQIGKELKGGRIKRKGKDFCHTKDKTQLCKGYNLRYNLKKPGVCSETSHYLMRPLWLY